jgi:hypothetical protein
MISGIANSPIPDRENELILSEAMEAAIPAFMKLPFLHVDHSERPAGAVTTCRVLKAGDPVLDPNHREFDVNAKPGDTYFKGYIPEDGDCDDIWDKIEKGHYNKISIYGVRTSASPECKLMPHQRVSPCVTKSIRLWSFSLVGENAINPNSYIKIAKSFSENLCDEFEQNTIALIKAGFPDLIMAEKPDQVSQTAGNPESEVIADAVTKSELDPVIQDVTLIKGDMAELKTGITGILEFLKKSDDTSAATDFAAATVSDEYITKANLESTLDLIVKAKIDLAVADIKKAYDAKFTEFEKQMTAFGHQTIEKGGNTVILSMDGTEMASYKNPFLANLDALGDE